MAYPPVIPPNTRTDATDMVTVHARDHNQIADALNQVPWSYVKTPVWALINTPTGIANGGTQSIVGLSNQNFTALATRRYRIEVLANLNHATANGLAVVNIKDGSTQLRRIVTYCAPLGGYTTMARGFYEGTFTAGLHTINVDLVNFTAGNLGMDGNDASYIGIIDVGPA